MLTCKQFLQELNDYPDPSIDPETKRHLESHVSQCPNCFVVVDTTMKTLKVYKGMEPKRPRGPPEPLVGGSGAEDGGGELVVRKFSFGAPKAVSSRTQCSPFLLFSHPFLSRFPEIRRRCARLSVIPAHSGAGMPRADRQK